MHLPFFVVVVVIVVIVMVGARVRIRKQSRNRCGPVHSAPLAVPSDSDEVGVGVIKQVGSLAVAATSASS